MFKAGVTFLWALFCIATASSAHAATEKSTWSFDVLEPGTYQLLIEHNVGKNVPNDVNITYSITLDGKTQQRDVPLIPNRMFIPLQANIQTPQTVRIAVQNAPQSILRYTKVYFLQQDSWLPGSYSEAQQDRGFKELRQLKALFEQPEDQIDLTEAKLTIDKMIDPSIDIEATRQQLQGMVSDIRAMVRANATANEKLSALKAYLYQPGPWNHGVTFQYDFDDPLGTRLKSKTIAEYLASRKGNCISMPLLFILLGDKLGLDVTASKAPLHVFVKYTDDAGTVYNLEATSGANPSRDSWLRSQFPSITDRAVESGIYLRRLSRKETVALMGDLLIECYQDQKQYEKMIAVCDLLLLRYPIDVYAMLKKGTAYSRLIQQQFVQKYPNARDIPFNLRRHFAYLARNNQYWFTKAESLGWREPSKENEEQYLQRVRAAANNQ